MSIINYLKIDMKRELRVKNKNDGYNILIALSEISEYNKFNVKFIKNVLKFICVCNILIEFSRNVYMLTNDI